MDAWRLLGLAWAVAGLGCGAPAGPRVAALPAPGPADLFPAVSRAKGPEGPTVRAAAAEPPSEVIQATTRAATTGTTSVLARVNGEPILVQDVRIAAAAYLAEIHMKVPESQWADYEAKIIQAQLDELVNRELLMQDAKGKVNPKQIEKVRQNGEKDFDNLLRKYKKQLNLGSDEELKAALEKQGRSLEEMRRQHVQGYVAMEYIKNLVADKINAIEREDLLDYYKQNQKDFDRAERVVWQHIYIDADRFPSVDVARQQAELVLRKAQDVKRDDQFAALVLEHSHSPTKEYRRGEGEGTERGQIRPPEVEDVLFRLQASQVGPLIEALHGFHIVRVVDHQKAGKVSFEAAMPEIKKKLQEKIFMREMKRIIEDLKAKAYIEYVQ